MNQLTVTQPSVFEHRGVPLTNSRQVAEFFGKRHDTVLRTLRDLREIAEINPGWFRDTTYVDEGGRTYPSVNLTRDGFTLLAMGFTGEEAIRFKMAYIEQFNAMEAELTRPNSTPSKAKISGALLREMGKTIVHIQDRFNLSPNAMQTFAANLYGAAGITMPEPVLAEQFYTTTDLAEKYGLPPNMFGKLVKHLKTEHHGETRLTTAPTSGKQVAQWYWNRNGADAVAELMDEPPKVLPFIA